MKTKEKNKTKKVILQDRDYEVMRYILEQKFLSREQITKWFYKTLDIAKVRLWKLIFSGYLKKEPIALSSKDHFLITGLGLRALAERGVNGIRPASSIDIRCYFHDRTVTDIRLLFEDIGLAKDWKSERILKAENGSFLSARQTGKKIPDGMFLSPAGKRIAFELELAPKENSRYKKILAGYQNVDRVFYVVRGDALFNRLRGLMTNKMLISRLEDIEKDILSAEVFWGSNRITIKELIDAK
jgi:hypothetical protein